MKKTLITILSSLVAILFVTTATYAIGTLTPVGNSGDDTQYTLNDIYNKLVTSFGPSEEGSGSMIVPDTVSASFATLTEIYNAIPPTLLLVSTTTTVPIGINRSTTTLTAIDSDLTVGNIKQGVTIFGVTGTLAGAGGTLTWSTDQGNYIYTNALAVCSGTVNGSTGWRLPNSKELIESPSLNGYSYWSNAIDLMDNAVIVDSSFIPSFAVVNINTSAHTLCVK